MSLHLVACEWELRLSAWPSAAAIALPRGELREVEAVECIAQGGERMQLEAGEHYTVDFLARMIRPVHRWPRLANAPDAVRVRYVTAA